MEAIVGGALKRRYGMAQDFLSWLGFGILMKRGVCLQDVSDRVSKISPVQKKYHRPLLSLMEVESCFTSAAAPDLIINLSAKYVNGDPRNIAYIGKIVYTIVSIKMLFLYIWLV